MEHRQSRNQTQASRRAKLTDIPHDVSFRGDDTPATPSKYPAISLTATKLLLFLSVLATVAPIEAASCLSKGGDCSESPSSCCPDFTCFSMGWYAQCEETVAQEFDFCCPWDHCAQKRDCEEGLTCVDYETYTQCEQGDPEPDDDEATEPLTPTVAPADQTGSVETCVLEYGECGRSECCPGMQCVDFGDYTQCRRIGDNSGACLAQGSTCGLDSTACCPSLACVKLDGFRSECKKLDTESFEEGMYPISVIDAEATDEDTISPASAPTDLPTSVAVPEAATCAAEWESCFLTDCCGEMTCYKHEYYSECRQPTYDPNTCLGNYHQCNSSDKPCCQGLECHEIDENYSQCLVPGAPTPPKSTETDGDICLALYGDCMNNDEACCSGLMCIQLNEHYAQCRHEFAGEWEECSVQSCMDGLVCVNYDTYSQCRKPGDVNGTNADETDEEETCVAKFGDCHGGKGCCDDLKCIKMNEFHSQCLDEFAEEWDDCSRQECESGLVCVKYNDYFSQCRKQSDVPAIMGHLPDDEDSDVNSTPPDDDGSCENLWGNCHDDPEACCDGLVCIQLNDYFSQCRNQCAGKYEDCKHQGCCDGLECVQQDEHYSQCLDPDDPDEDIEEDDDVCRPIWQECTGGKTCCDNLECVYFDEDHSQCQPPSDPDNCVVEFHDCSENANCCSGLSCVSDGPDVKCLSVPDTRTRRGLRSSSTRTSKLIRSGW